MRRAISVGLVVSLVVAASFAVRAVVVDSSGTLVTVGGSGPTGPNTGGYGGDGGPAINAQLRNPLRVAFVPFNIGILEAGDLLFTDTLNGRVRRVSSSTHTISTLVGPLNELRNFAYGIAIDSEGNVFIGSYDAIVKYSPSTGQTETVVNMNSRRDESAYVLAFDGQGDLLIGTTNRGYVYRLPHGTSTPVSSGQLPVTAGTGVPYGFNGDGPVATTMIGDIACVYPDSAGNIYLCDLSSHRIWLLSGGQMTTLVGGDGSLDSPSGIAFDAAGHMIVTDTGRNVIYAYDLPTHGRIVIAGTGVMGFNGDGPIPATTALLSDPVGVTIGPDDRLYFADNSNHRIRAISFDVVPPLIDCGSADGLWHTADVEIACTAHDDGSGLTNPSDASFVLITSVATGTETANAMTNARTVCDAVGNCAPAGPIGGNMIDKKVPQITCGVSDGLWHATDVSIACTAEDAGSGLANPADASFSLSTAVATGTAIPHAQTNSRVVCDAVGNCSTAGPIGGLMVDKKPPQVSCGAADGAWHAGDVSISCTAQDDAGGLANPSDANILLTTSVTAGAETAGAPTNARTICDTVGNCAPAGPIVGNMIDKKAPQISLLTPTATTYTIGQAVAASYSCTDGGSGVTSCSGTLPNGTNLDTSTVGSRTFGVNSADGVGNTASASVGYDVSYGGTFTSVTPASIWLGLKNSDDVGTRFDLLAEVLKNGAVVGSGMLSGVPGGSSGFNNAVQRAISVALGGATSIVGGDTLGLRLSVRIAADGIGHRSGTARLWFNDAAANSHVDTTVNGVARTFYLVTSGGLSVAPGTGPKKTIDVFVDRAAGGNLFKSFGTWSVTF